LTAEVEIANLLSDYCWYVDRLEVDSVMGLFTDDATFDLGHGRVHTGHASLRSLYDRLGVYAATSHHVSNPRIDAGTELATARSGLYAHHVRHDGSTMTLWGVYLDELVRVDGSWRISNRSLRASAESGGRPEGGQQTHFELLPRRG
jgi:ketosteroid isomerase-like protein